MRAARLISVPCVAPRTALDWHAAPVDHRYAHAYAVHAPTYLASTYCVRGAGLGAGAGMRMYMCGVGTGKRLWTLVWTHRLFGLGFGPMRL